MQWYGQPELVRLAADDALPCGDGDVVLVAQLGDVVQVVVHGKAVHVFNPAYFHAVILGVRVGVQNAERLPHRRLHLAGHVPPQGKVAGGF